MRTYSAVESFFSIFANLPRYVLTLLPALPRTDTNFPAALPNTPVPPVAKSLITSTMLQTAIPKYFPYSITLLSHTASLPNTSELSFINLSTGSIYSLKYPSANTLAMSLSLITPFIIPTTMSLKNPKFFSDNPSVASTIFCSQF
ncbi:hypothetical protein [Caldicellulosiruptor obsidiansis]|uniref:hypothetical protein n=1 Tax=Caldicellulosiruptor obsidiansis TaxID=717609 RepID=UPI0003099353|nr:hypothetical protein [Caldicellulosiruptor obsidiansis]